MTSKISYSKFIKENLKHRAWLIAFSFIAHFLILPVYTLMIIDNQKNLLTHTSTPKALKDWALYNFSGIFNGNENFFVIILLVGMGLICGITGFSYIHSKIKQDFYHSMAVTRTQWFIISYISGLLIFLIPYVLFSLCTLFVGQVHGLMTMLLFTRCLKAILYGIIIFFLSYHTSILAMMLTGQIVTSVLAYIVLLVYGSAIIGLLEVFCDTFFNTWFSGSSIFDHVFRYCSPVALIGNFVSRTSPFEHLIFSFSHLGGYSFKLWISTFVFLIIFIFGAWFLYKKYPAEASENALSFPKVQGLIKVLVAVPSSLAIGLFSNVFFGYAKNNHWIFTMSILFVFLVCFIIEFIYHHDLKMVLSGKISTGISLIGVLIILCIFRFDVLGYDTYIPKESSLKSMSVYCYDNNNYYDYQIYQHNIVNILEETTTSDFHKFYELAKTGKKQDLRFDTSNTDNLCSIVVRFDKKIGAPIYRTYDVEREPLVEAFRYAYDNPEYRKQENPAFKIDSKSVKQFTLEDIYNNPLPLDKLTVKQRQELLNAYKQDFLNADFNVLINESPISKLYVGFENNTDTTLENRLYIYKNFTNTLALLEKYGYSIREKIDINDVIRMTYYPSEYEIQESEDKNIISREITNPQEIQELLNRLPLSDSCHLLDNMEPTYKDVHIGVLLNTGYEIQFTLPDEY